MSALSDRLNKARGDRSVRAVGRAAQKVNGTGESTVIPYFNGKHGVPSLPVLTALAEVLDVPLSELRMAAGLPAGERLPYKPPAEADLLSRSQRAALDVLIKSIVEPRGAMTDEHATDTASPPATQPRAPRQADQDQKTRPAPVIKTRTVKPTDLSERRSRREAGSSAVQDSTTVPDENQEELPEDAIAARTRDPRFAPDDPAGYYGTNDIGEENQDIGYDE